MRWWSGLKWRIAGSKGEKLCTEWSLGFCKGRKNSRRVQRIYGCQDVQLHEVNDSLTTWVLCQWARLVIYVLPWMPAAVYVLPVAWPVIYMFGLIWLLICLFAAWLVMCDLQECDPLYFFPQVWPVIFLYVQSMLPWTWLMVCGSCIKLITYVYVWMRFFIYVFWRMLPLCVHVAVGRHVCASMYVNLYLCVSMYVVCYVCFCQLRIVS
jgi:hypothetical protein